MNRGDVILIRFPHPSGIFTIEREDICEVLWELIDLCGFEGSEEWLREREW